MHVRPQSVQVSVNDFIVRAVALALVDVPGANAQWDAKSGEVVPCPGVDIAIAVATDKGLITPIVRGASAKSLTQISAEARPSTSCAACTWSRSGFWCGCLELKRIICGMRA